ncbi:MAG: hypothetical protein ACOX1P_01095 [Thermoguttaceae bacterium]|jgi:Spy/CpxP family protein refolding chaperone
MFKTFSRVLAPLLVLAIAIPVMAQEKQKRGQRKQPAEKGRQQAQVLPRQLLEGLELSAEQKAKLEAIAKEMRAPLVEARKALGDILTDEQKAAREAAMKAAKEAGKKPQEAQKAAEEALKLTPEQKEKMTKVRKKMAELEKTIRDKVMEVLTPEQRAAVEEKMKARRDEAKKAQKGKKAAEK